MIAAAIAAIVIGVVATIAVAPRTRALLAGVIAALGDRERAFALLDEAYSNRDYWLTALRVSPVYAPMREDPRYAAMLRKIDSR